MTNAMLAMARPISEIGLVILGLVALLGVFWMTQLVLLMLLEDALFPDRFGKVLWAAAFVFVAPFAFRAWKSARLVARPAEPAA
jgi:hypothetical protein